MIRAQAIHFCMSLFFRCFFVLIIWQVPSAVFFAHVFPGTWRGAVPRRRLPRIGQNDRLHEYDRGQRCSLCIM